MGSQRRLLAGLLVVFAPAALAAPDLAPRVKPEPSLAYTLIAPEQADRLEVGFAAASEGRWDRARAALKTLEEPIAYKLLQWRIAIYDRDADFADLNRALEALSDWPLMHRVTARAEEALSAAGLGPNAVVAWFDGRPPMTGEGKLALADALTALGQEQEAGAWIRSAWREHALPLSRQREVLNAYGEVLNADDHAARANVLLWSGQETAAGRLLPLLDTDQRHLARARLALMQRKPGVDAAIARVPAYLRSDPGLAHARAEWRRQAGQEDDAIAEALTQAGPDLLPEAAIDDAWRERRILIGRALKARLHERAYALAAGLGAERGADFADAQWIAGWMALRYLNDPETAAEHFETLYHNVRTPISRARGAYWRGRAAEALGQGAEARDWYALAAEHDIAYYGQLAAQALADPKLSLPADPEITAADVAAFEARDLVRATRLAGHYGPTWMVRAFLYHLDDRMESEAEHRQLAWLARDYGLYGVATRTGKTALARGLVVPEAAYPTIELPPTQGPDPALVFALSRQESEFEPAAVSSAGARGLMQLMPATAQRVSRRIGEPYSQSRLTDDPVYNLTLGMALLDDLVDDYEGSYILAAIAYNAGPGRATKWIADYGDPRDPNIDVIDWVEHIPFSETRNYVQRVLENLQVYRARLNGNQAEIRLGQDLRRGGEAPGGRS